jgi:polyisoprenoid-binding protein YceI
MSTTDSAHTRQQLAGTRWRLEPSGSSAEFRVPYIWGLASVKGRFQRLDGWLEVDGDDQWSMELTVDTVSLDTGNARRDEHLRSTTFFDVQHHPVMRFQSSRVTDPGGGRLEVEGELEAAGERVWLQLEVTIDHADGRLDLDAAATVDQRQLAMVYSPLGAIRAPTAVNVHARLSRER